MSDLFLNQAASGWSEAIWRASWQGGLAVILVWTLTWAWQSMPPLLRSWLWRFVFIKFAVAFFFSTALELAWLPADAAPTLITHTTDTLNPEPAFIEMAPVVPSPAISVWPMLLWLGGLGMYIVRLQRSWWTTRRLRQAGTPVEATDVLDMVARLSERMGMARPPSVRTSSDAPGPLVIGICRPVVILPARLLERDDQAELELVLAHELAHCRRWDLAWDWLPTPVRALFFFHPLAWLACREARLASEIACDELAIQDTDKSTSAYANVLLRVAMEVSRSGCPRPLGAIGVFESYQSLKRRLKALANFGSMSPRQLRLTLVPAFAIAFALIFPRRLTSQTIIGPAGERIHRAEYEIKKAAAKAAHADLVAAEKVRDEARERWITANRLFNSRALSEEELRMAKLTWDNKTYEAERKRAAANKAQVEADVAKAILAAGQQGEQALKEARRRGEYEIKKAAAVAALAESELADKTRDETRERWIAAQRLFNSHALSDEELRQAKLTWDNKIREAATKREAANKAQVDADMAKRLLATGQQVAQGVKTQAEKKQAAAPSPTKPNQQLKDTLDKNIMIEFAQSPLQDALDYMAERYDFHFQIDEKAFRNREIKNIGAATVSGSYVNKPLADVLKKVLDQAKATYRVSQTGDSLIIVPK